MDFSRYPERTERLAAAYALGTLRGGARRRFEQLAQRHPHVRAAALTWQGRLGGLNELQAPLAPPAAVWTRIDNLLQAGKDEARLAAQRAPQAPVATTAGAWWHRLGLWRGLAGASVLASLVGAWVAVGVHQQQGEALARLQSELQTVTAQARQIEYVAVLGEAQTLQLAAQAQAVQAVPALAISLEPKGGVPGEGGPTGPVLFSGPLVHATL